MLENTLQAAKREAVNGPALQHQPVPQDDCWCNTDMKFMGINNWILIKFEASFITEENSCLVLEMGFNT